MKTRQMRFSIFCLLMACAPLAAQTVNATVRGTATDPSGAVVVGAEVSLANIGTNVTRLARTNENGDYELPNLLRGTYRLSITARGFKQFVVENIILETAQIRRVDAMLSIGETTAEVTVRANAAVIETDTGKIAGVFTNQRIDAAPYKNALWAFSSVANVKLASAWGFQIAGQPASQIQEGLDGHTTDGAINNITQPQYFDEFEIVTGNNAAENSRVAYLNMSSRSGSNGFHGRAAYFHRNSALEARNFFAARKGSSRGHQTVAHLGGPIQKNKTFFYAGYNREWVPGATYYLRTVPTDSMRTGDFAQLGKTIKDPLSGAPFPNHAIPASRQSSLALQVMKQYVPSPNLGSPDSLANNYGFLWRYPGDYIKEEDYIVRIDEHFSEANRLYGRLISQLPPAGSAPYVLAGSYPSLGWTRKLRAVSLLIDDTHIFSPALFNTFRFGWYRMQYKDGGETNGYRPLEGDAVVKELNLQGVNPRNLSGMGFPTMSITGYSSLTVTNGGEVRDDQFSYGDTFTWVKGKHVLKFGAEFKPFRYYRHALSSGTFGVFSFNGTFTGNAQADFLLGLPYSSYRLDQILNHRTRTDAESGLYAQDSFKVNKRLTLDYGLRWERFGVAGENDGLAYNWDPGSGNLVVPPGKERSVSPLYPRSITVTNGEVAERPSLANFAPRLAVAYRVSDRIVVRGAYGMFTETLGRFARISTGGPFEIGETFFNSVTNGVPSFAFPNPFPSGTGTVASQSVAGYPLDSDNGRIHQFNFTVERQIRDLGVRLSYLGSRSRGLNYSVERNKPAPSLIPFTQSRRPYPQLVSTAWIQNDGMSNYNSLSFEVQRKVGQLTFDNHWTWANNYFNYPNALYPYGPKGWYRDATTPRHRLVFNVHWDIPVGRGHAVLGRAPRALDFIVGGWKLYWMANFETGGYFSAAFSGSDPSNTNTSGGTPDRIGNGNLPADERSITRWFDASAFRVPVAGTLGNCGANILEGPGVNAHNASFVKETRLSERLILTYMAAVTNLFNHPSFSNPASNISVPGTAGVISSTKGHFPNRQIVMRMRLDF